MSERVVRRLRGLEDLPLKGDEKEISQGKSLISLDNFFTPRATSESKTWSFTLKAGFWLGKNSGYANLWKSKIWRLSLLHHPPPQKKRTTNPPDPDPPRPTIWSSPQFVTCEWFRTLYEVLHEVQTITIWFYDCNGKIISDSDELP